MDELVERLQQEQPVEARLYPERSAVALRAAIDAGYLFVKFLQSGTEVGVTLDRGASDAKGADFAAGTGRVTLVGELVLNFDRVRYHGFFDLETLSGLGRVEYLGPYEATADEAAN